MRCPDVGLQAPIGLELYIANCALVFLFVRMTTLVRLVTVLDKELRVMRLDVFTTGVYVP